MNVFLIQNGSLKLHQLYGCIFFFSNSMNRWERIMLNTLVHFLIKTNFSTSCPCDEHGVAPLLKTTDTRGGYTPDAYEKGFSFHITRNRFESVCFVTTDSHIGGHTVCVHL